MLQWYLKAAHPPISTTPYGQVIGYAQISEMVKQMERALGAMPASKPQPLATREDGQTKEWPKYCQIMQSSSHAHMHDTGPAGARRGAATTADCSLPEKKIEEC